MKGWLFAKRNFKEIIRDPLLYIFCLGFPLVMLIFFQIMSSTIIGNAEKQRDLSLDKALTEFSAAIGVDKVTGKTAADSYMGNIMGAAVLRDEIIKTAGNDTAAVNAANEQYAKKLQEAKDWIGEIAVNDNKMIVYKACDDYTTAQTTAVIGFEGAKTGTSNFLLKNNIPGVILFGFTFVMLFLTLLVSKDRSTTFLTRLYTSPLKQSDYVIGYIIPGFVLGVSQEIICLAVGYIMSLINGEPLNFSGLLLTVAAMLPSLPFFIGTGILFGSLLNDKSAPATSSAVVTVASMLSGAFMPIATMGATFETICYYLPFYSAVQLGRGALTLDFASYGIWWRNLTVPLVYAVIMLVSAVMLFGAKMKSDNK